jgi:hypothetical protein
MNNQDFEKQVTMTMWAIGIWYKEQKLTLETARAQFLQLLQGTEILNVGNYMDFMVVMRNLVLNRYMH